MAGVVQPTLRDAGPVEQLLPLRVVGAWVQGPSGWCGEDVAGILPEVTRRLERLRADGHEVEAAWEFREIFGDSFPYVY